MTGPTVELVHDGDVVVARLHGDVDLAVTSSVAGEVLAAVSNDARGLVVDLTNVRYLDSAGIHMLFEFSRELDAGRQAMVLVVGANALVRRLVDITNLHEAATICATPEDAKAELRNGDPRA